MKEKTRTYLLFNLNIIVAGLTALFVSSQSAGYVSYLIGRTEITSTVSTIAHFLVYIPLNAVLYYIAFRTKYTDNLRLFSTDIAKVYSTQIPTFVLYYGGYFIVTYVLLRIEVSPSLTTVIAWVVNTALSRIIHTWLAFRAGVFSNT